ncbi:hypothetical protein LAD11_06110 [Escherichia coli]|uniref:hypothetical protein n=1 Tax=Escherichia coli TaxID=562 RepID=UPI00226DBFC9|nr:hypothetical protein [Escherichia coli]MCY0057377.1 hypothetical protein [Escherichia coli]
MSSESRVWLSPQCGMTVEQLADAGGAGITPGAKVSFLPLATVRGTAVALISEDGNNCVE